MILEDTTLSFIEDMNGWSNRTTSGGRRECESMLEDYWINLGALGPFSMYQLVSVEVGWIATKTGQNFEILNVPDEIRKFNKWLGLRWCMFLSMLFHEMYIHNQDAT